LEGLSARVIFKIGQYGVFHAAGSLEKPAAGAAPEIRPKNPCFLAAQMNIGGFESHAVQQVNFIPLFG
jgi:hypothetical protein